MATTGSLLESWLSRSQRATLKRTGEQLRNVWSAIRNYPTALVSLGLLVAFVLIAVFAPLIAPYNPDTIFKVQSTGLPLALEGPSLAHPFGTTHLGRDVFSQWVYGSRVSLLVGLLSGFSVMIVGTSVGLIAGYYKGTVDLVVMRVVDVLYGIPQTPLVLVIAMFMGASVWNVVVAMTLVLWRTMARIIRSQTLSLSERPFVKSARASGASDFRIIFYHIAPNILPLMFIQTTITVSGAIVLEAGISFLGLGAQDMTSWGTMLQLAFSTGAIREAWWWVLPPGFSITLLVLAFFYMSRALEEITNPEVDTEVI
ncbi:ABC transporter permease [Halobacterium sp. KA-6]|uniref:ABC transporter permease n=1 Tax=Halobacterium sp. KA-6 TaxID=2896368 RepID=UPI001E349704|nr:ABC transporter permease [Halobacterium sp. KA-6]MCD2204059.1 ABC transporter permease [Halobacterium sp. KA-6]